MIDSPVDSSIQQLNITYHPEQDRLLLRVGMADGGELLLWLTIEGEGDTFHSYMPTTLPPHPHPDPPLPARGMSARYPPFYGDLGAKGEGMFQIRGHGHGHTHPGTPQG